MDSTSFGAIVSPVMTTVTKPPEKEPPAPKAEKPTVPKPFRW